MFITFEGIEGSGKSTLVKNISAYFNANGIDYILTREPGGSNLGKHVRSFLMNKNFEVCPTAELLLFMADRAQHVSEVILPALEAGKIVLCDRFTHSTVAYQGYGRGLSREQIDLFNKEVGIVPDMTFILDLPVEVGLSRAKKRDLAEQGEVGKFESEKLDFHNRVREGYLSFRDDPNVEILDATKAPEDIFVDWLEIFKNMDAPRLK